ncbi:response regulator [Reyranella sp.]|uniref:response regulator n=1 Tax=Reyranella sp. TaxID=1929291 RepID=UPI003BA863C8
MSARQSSHPVSAPHGTPRILVVGDARAPREALESVLSREGFETASAASVPEAIRALERQPVDAVVADLSLNGGRDGLDVARWTRRHFPETGLLLLADAMVWIPTSSPLAGVPLLVRPVTESTVLGHLRDLTGRPAEETEAAVVRH